MESTLLLALVAGSALLWWLLRKRAEGVEAEEVAPAEAGEYHCVEIRPNGPACEAVKRIEGRVFLADEAPSIPLPGCTNNDGACDTCIYVHHADRRLHRRRSVVNDPHYSGKERRRGAAARSGRRLIDRLQAAHMVAVSYDSGR